MDHTYSFGEVALQGPLLNVGGHAMFGMNKASSSEKM